MCFLKSLWTFSMVIDRCYITYTVCPASFARAISKHCNLSKNSRQFISGTRKRRNEECTTPNEKTDGEQKKKKKKNRIAPTAETYIALQHWIQRRIVLRHTRLRSPNNLMRTSLPISLVVQLRSEAKFLFYRRIFVCSRNNWKPSVRWFILCLFTVFFASVFVTTFFRRSVYNEINFNILLRWTNFEKWKFILFNGNPISMYSIYGLIDLWTWLWCLSQYNVMKMT